MLKSAFHVAVRHPSSLVFIFVVVASFAMAFSRAGLTYSGSEIAWMVSLSLVYSIVGTVVFWAVIASDKPRHKILYLGVQIALGALILHLMRGSGWLIMLPLASHSVVLFSPREAIIPCILIVMVMNWNRLQVFGSWVPFLQSSVIFGSAVFFAAVFTNFSIRDARAREEIERMAEKLRQANHALQEYSAKVQDLTAIQERNRLAREIHDGLGHYLTAMSMQVKVASALVVQDPTQALPALDKLQTMVLEALADVRQSLAALRSDPLAARLLPDNIRSIIDEIQPPNSVVELIVQGEIRPLAPAVELAIFRAAQEGLTNASKHAQATQVNLTLSYHPQEISLSVEDNGIGSNLDLEHVSELESHFGLFGLRERVQMLGGSMRLRTAPGQGFCLLATIPANGDNKRTSS